MTAVSAPVAALSLGAPEVSSFLGQPLLLRVPVILDDASDPGPQCARLVSPAGSDVPTLALGRIGLERGVTQSYLQVTTAQPVEEPVLRVILEIGCTQRVRREFTLLLDPPAGLAASGVGQVAAPAPSIEFGHAEVIGVRGQPLLMMVPITGELAASLTSACVRAGRSDTAEPPRVLNDARVMLVDREGARALRIHTPDPVNDARVRVLVELGCERPISHEFVVQIDAPRLAATPSDETAPRVATAPAKRAPKPVARVAPPAVPPMPAAAPAPAAPPATLETPATQRADAPPIEPARLPPREPPRQTDRLVLAAPEDAPRAEAPRPEPTPAERELVMKRLEELAAEVKTLRAELDASALRNRELAEKARSASYAWAAAAGAALLLGIGVVLGWRNRPRTDEPQIDAERAGPMTRILGKSSEKPPAPAMPLPAFTEGAGPNTVAAIVAAHKAAQEQDTQGASTAIMVTEFRDTTQVLGELYSPYVEHAPETRSDPATRPAQAAKPESSDLDLGNERTTAFAPQTKTEIAVDIDLFERNSQIGRDLQREYERLDLAGRAKEQPPAPQEPDPSTQLGATTLPMTTKLALDLDLDMSTIAQYKVPKKDE
jgi:hypothetical protein